MRPDCSDVCEIVHIMLNGLGFEISDSDEDHTDMIEALSECKLVRNGVLQKIRNYIAELFDVMEGIGEFDEKKATKMLKLIDSVLENKK